MQRHGQSDVSTGAKPSPILADVQRHGQSDVSTGAKPSPILADVQRHGQSDVSTGAKPSPILADVQRHGVSVLLPRGLAILALHVSRSPSGVSGLRCLVPAGPGRAAAEAREAR